MRNSNTMPTDKRLGHEAKIEKAVTELLKQYRQDLGKWSALRMLAEYKDNHWYRYLYWEEPHLLYSGLNLNEAGIDWYGEEPHLLFSGLNMNLNEADIDWYGIAGLAVRAEKNASEGHEVLGVAASLAMGRPVDLRSLINTLTLDAAEVIIRGVAAAAGRELPQPTERLALLEELYTRPDTRAGRKDQPCAAGDGEPAAQQ